MSRFTFLVLFLSLSSFSLVAQTASTICLEEVKNAYTSIDHQALLQAPGHSTLDYTRKYSVRANPDESFSAKENRTYAPGQLRWKHAEGLTVSDENEAFIYREGQYVIYRTKSQLKKEAPVIPNVDLGIFAHCTALDCQYTADRSNKSAYLVVDAAGQEKYQISSMTVETNPLDGSLVRIQVNYLAPNIYLEADYHFEKIHNEAQPAKKLGSVSSIFLQEDGSPQPKYEGIKMMDYRR